MPPVPYAHYPSPLTPTTPPTPDYRLLSPLSANVEGGQMMPSRNLQLSPVTGMQQAGPNGQGGEFGVGNAFMDPRWASMGQFYTGAHDMIGLERRTQFKTDPGRCAEVKDPLPLPSFDFRCPDALLFIQA